MTCHPLFSDMTLQSQILVIESLFLTLVSKFIRKYLLSDNFHTCTPLALIPLFPLSNLATIFFRKNYRKRKILLPVLDFHALAWDNVGFLWKIQCCVRRCARAYGMFYACKCSLDLAILYRKNIQLPAVTKCRIPGIFVVRFKREEADHTPCDYLVTLFSFSRFIRQENLCYRFLKSGNNVTVIFTESTRYYACLNEEICWQIAKKWEVKP